MPTDVADDDFFAEFADDYFAECEEHLTLIRRDLLVLEDFVHQSQTDRSLLEELFGTFHSFKGMSGMIGVKEAEQLAHEMESYLRVLREKHVVLTQAGMDALIAGTKMLEQVIDKRRTQEPAPNIEPVIQQIIAVVPDLTAPTVSETDAGSTLPVKAFVPLKLKPEEIAHLAEALQRGKKAWQFEFTPVPALIEQGIDVNTIRDRLLAIGELIHAAPRPTAEENFVFDFVVASDAEESIFASWEKEGLTYTPYIQEESEIEEESQATFSPPPPPPLTTPAPSNVVRVDLARLDELMHMVGDLVISRSRLEDKLTKLETTIPAPELRALRETNLMLARQLRDLRAGVMRVRLVPISEIFARMQFVVRDIARETQKKVMIELSGQETEIDKFVVERMMDPLLHLVRNAISHGLESEEQRLQLGKPPEGKIALRAATAGEMVVIEIEDDGRGVDIENITAKANKLGLIDDQMTLDTKTALDIICSPGFSTREEVDLISGRGVGMAVVKNTVHELGGSLTLESKIGEGSRFTIQLPLTLAIADALIISTGGQIFAVPQSSVREVIQIESIDVRVFENNEIIVYRDGVLPLLRLSRLFGLAESFKRHLFVFVVGSGLNAVGIVVDGILGLREIVVRTLRDPLVQVMGIAGATELGDGRVVLILDVAALTNTKLQSKL
ncbi:MAG: chemotaxis protein CheA [Aphanothece sp. CMT-3BRIN-NPC111]|jgi:two-component system chemotaxis sensor kinase CheA|nr:chemotaxis protein CheA [Aphanothece sp. CMT-3BRIN-NPC111]